MTNDNIYSEANPNNELTASAFLHSLVKNPAVCSGHGVTYSLDLAAYTPDQFSVKNEFKKSKNQKKSLHSGKLSGSQGRLGEKNGPSEITAEGGL